ncbi:MAG: DUF4185 domain-containing protein, partial [Ignavibacteriaceae bacterium]|nr:DUF4185 domain-containing protein [Ignavibacteriaceae bacterium]
ISDKGYSYANVTSFFIDLKLQVGTSQGCFNLGYLTTKATSGMLSSGNSTWAPISFPHPIGIPDSAMCTVKYETRPAPEWDNLLDRQSGWTGADGIYSIPLNEYDVPSNIPSGKHLLLFSDTFIGEVDSNNRRVNTRMVNNTLGLLQSNIPDSNQIQFFWKSDSTNIPKTVFVPNTPNAKPGDWYWLMDGIAINDTIYVFALRLNATTTGLGFEVNGVALLKFTMDAQNFISDVQQSDTPLYYYNAVDGSEFVLGQAVMPMTNISGNPLPDGYIYVYGPISNASGKKLIAARVQPANIENFNKWEYWNGQGWNSEIQNCAPIANGISQEFSVTPIGINKYLLVYQSGNNVAVQEGESPVGPFGIFHSIYNCPEILIDPDVFVYNAKAHPSLSTKDELLISYNVNSLSFSDHFTNADIYRPRFIYLKMNDSLTAINYKNETLLNEYKLEQNYPNPFNPTTRISFTIPYTSNISIKVFSVIGELVTELVNKEYTTGNYSIDFNVLKLAKELSSGIYFYHFEADNFSQTKKMIYLR